MNIIYTSPNIFATRFGLPVIAPMVCVRATSGIIEKSNSARVNDAGRLFALDPLKNSCRLTILACRPRPLRLGRHPPGKPVDCGLRRVGTFSALFCCRSECFGFRRPPNATERLDKISSGAVIGRRYTFSFAICVVSW